MPLLSLRASSLNNGPAVKDNFTDAPPAPASIMGPLLRGIRGSWGDLYRMLVSLDLWIVPVRALLVLSYLYQVDCTFLLFGIATEFTRR